MENDQTQPIQTLTSPLPPITTPPISSLPPKPSQLPLVILSLISLIFLSGMVYFYVQVQSLRKTATTTTRNTQPTPSPMTTNSNWKQFKNNVFEFKYPPMFSDLILKDKEFGSKMTEDFYEATYLDPNQTGGGPGYTLMFRVIGPSTNPKGLSINNWLADQGLNSEGYGGDFTRTNNEVVIDSQSTILQTGIGKGFTEPTEYNLYVTSGNNIYTLSYTIQSNEEGARKYGGNFFDQITSTFKFAN
ncbi:MAG: hypothetical protein WCL07_02880 [bacterium]